MLSDGGGVLVAGADQPHKVSGDPAQDKDQQAFSAMHAPGAPVRRPPQGAGDVRHHLQVHGHQPAESRALHIQRRCQPLYLT